MEDSQIVTLFWERSEDALTITQEKYGNYCRSIAYRILGIDMEAEECVNDTLLKAWNAIPPQKPERLGLFLGKITRNLALDRFRYHTARKREDWQMPVVVDELEEVLANRDSEELSDDLTLREALNCFLRSMSVSNRRIFLYRYWYFYSIQEIAKICRCSEGKVRSSLFRTRRSLKLFLEKEGIEI